MSTTAAIERRAEEIGLRNPAEICALRVVEGWVTYRGILAYYGDETVRVEIAGDGRDFKVEDIRYLSPCDEKANCASYRRGERVLLRKYGSTYIGTVERVGRTRLHVAVVLRSGRTRRFPVRAIEVARERRTTNY